MVGGTIQSTSAVLILENDKIRLVIRADLGGRIDQLKDLRTGKEWLWHPQSYDPTQTRSLPIGASFDDHWTGGWDEIFPNDVGGLFQGRDQVDHGELWSQHWQVAEVFPLGVKLTYQCQTVPVAIEKTIQLDSTRPEARITYRFENQSDDTIPFLFKQHAAITIEAGDEICLPDCLIEPAVLDFSKIIGQQKTTRFPKAFAADGQEIDVHQIPPESSQLQEFYYSSNLAVGECGIYNPDTRSSLLMQFDPADFPYVWVFQSYGGWRNHYVLVLEPCTTIPYDLEIACQNGTAAVLQPKEVQTRTLTVCLRSVN